MKLLIINESLNQGSTGRIAEQIGVQAQSYGWNVLFAHSPRSKNQSSLKSIEIGKMSDVRCHAIQTRLFDKHGLCSKRATRKFISQIDTFKPDIVHIHNIHGYYLNYKILFEYLRGNNIRVVMTLHDCWTFTGHCSHFERFNCDKWRNDECEKCFYKYVYPSSMFISASHKNFMEKRKALTGVETNMTLVPVSNWLGGLLSYSFLKNCRKLTIHNGIDLKVFRPSNRDNNINLRRKLGFLGKKIIIGCANPWDERKGYNDFLKLRQILSEEYVIIMIGLSLDQKKEVEKTGILGVVKTESQEELAQYYSMSDVFINTTYEDTFPTVNLEAMACGTPVITYNTGGSPESVAEGTCYIVGKGNLEDLKRAILLVCSQSKDYYLNACRTNVEENYDSRKVYKQYIKLYEELLEK